MKRRDTIIDNSSPRRGSSMTGKGAFNLKKIGTTRFKEDGADSNV